MPSPFPGMNPYLEHESVWHDFHERAIPLIAERLGAQVLPDFVVKLDEHLFIHELPSESRRLIGRGDLNVAHPTGLPAHGPGSAVASAPAEVTLPAVDVERLSYIEIRDRDDFQLICVIELLGSANKRRGPDREQYLSKRMQLLQSNVHLVEIDLHRGGPRMPIHGLPECEYCILVSRWQERPRAEAWPLRLRDPLPVIPIPLVEGRTDASLDLQEVLHRVYDVAGYSHYIYRHPIQPRLAESDVAWTEAMARGAPDAS